MKKLPLTDQPFRQIISEDKLYADKTDYIFEMINNFKSCFLLRPRRFGKTLLLDTIDQLFSGDKDLFKGLKIASLGYEFKKHPVIRLTMNYAETSNPDNLKKYIVADLTKVAQNEDVKVTSKFYDKILNQLLEGLSKKYGAGVVFLIDEYNASVSTYTNEPDLAQANAKVLNNFYSALKNNDKYLRFVFVTGITRFASTSLDSGPNKFQDLSLAPRYAGSCGFTISEFDFLFADRMKETLENLITRGYFKSNANISDLREKILSWYDGYDWFGPERVLNPYTILNFFYAKNFDVYWPLSGKPNHISTLIQERPIDLIQPKLDGYTLERIKKAELGGLEAVPILFHTGYLAIDNLKWDTVKKEQEDEREGRYSFRFPNWEVETSYIEYCLQTVFQLSRVDFRKLRMQLSKAFAENDAKFIARFIGYLLSNIMHRQPISEERYYHSLVQASFAAAGFETIGGQAGSIDQTSFVIILPNKQRVIVEIKYRSVKSEDKTEDIDNYLDSALKEAVRAMATKGYAESFKLNVKSLKSLKALVVAIYDRVNVKAFFAPKSPFE
ncbi:MAG: AAA family ATPase [Bifidobacteriaceae bacterium]|jgi:hypothetical protein|nr:AAA family ATPase [Bifidobacteriaceae bacterium]